jgi:DNA-binding NarL/FixJ family response regulator
MATDQAYARISDRPPIRETEVLLVDRHGYFRNGMREMLHRHAASIRVVGEAGTLDRALEVIPQLRPDVVLADIHLPGLLDTEPIRRITTLCPDVAVVVLSDRADGRDVLEAIFAGANGFLSKRAPISEIATAVMLAALGDSVLSRQATAALLQHLRSGQHDARPSPKGGATPTDLTTREHEVLTLMALGLGNTEIGQRLVISPRTARNHVASILKKLQMENRTQASIWAVKHGLA